MPKKTPTITKKEEPQPEATKPKRKAPATSKPKKAATPTKLSTAKKKTGKQSAATATPKPAKKTRTTRSSDVSTPKEKSPAAQKKPVITPEDIALRAYFIAEKRHREGRHGDETSDWVEAERQLIEESARPIRPKKKR